MTKQKVNWIDGYGLMCDVNRTFVIIGNHKIQDYSTIIILAFVDCMLCCFEITCSGFMVGKTNDCYMN